MAAAILTSGLTKKYGDFTAVDAIDLEVHAGEVFGFLGPNGAGKSTTIRCLLDLHRPTSGTATVLGLDSRVDSIEIHRHVGYLPGDLALYDKLTGREVIDYFANLRDPFDRSIIDELADRFDADLSKQCGEYSSGNRQKIGLIQAFMHRPELVVLDEPSTGLDPLVQQSLHELIGETAADGRTVFLSSHTLSEVERVAERVGIIRHGVLVETAKIDDLRQKAIRRLDFVFASDVEASELRSIDGVRSVEGDRRHYTVAYDGSLDAILREATRFGVESLRSRDADLEEIFLAFYRDDGSPAGAGADGTASDARS